MRVREMGETHLSKVASPVAHAENQSSHRREMPGFDGDVRTIRLVIVCPQAKDLGVHIAYWLALRSKRESTHPPSGAPEPAGVSWFVAGPGPACVSQQSPQPEAPPGGAPWPAGGSQHPPGIPWDPGLQDWQNWNAYSNQQPGVRSARKGHWKW